MPLSSNKSILEIEVELEWSQAEAAASDLESTLSDLERGVDVEVTFSAEELPFDDIPEDLPVEVETTETPEGKEIREGITFLSRVKAIEIAMNIAGNVFEFVKNLGEVTVGGFLDVEDAVARINAQTGTNIPDLDQLIRDLQAADLGESVEQIADVVIHAKQIGAPMQAAAEAALTFTHTFDENPETVLDSLNTLVSQKLVPNLSDAADLMTVFFQQGGNVGGDALAVVNSNAQSWSDMGLTAAEALSTLDSLQQGTGATATEAAKMLQTFDDALTAAAADPASEQNNMLRLMGITNPKDAGEAIGAETIDGFASAFATLPSDKQDLISGLFFGKGGKKFTGAIEGMTTQGGPFADFIGAAEEAATEIDNSLRGAIDDFVLEINTTIARLLSSDEIDLPGKIAALKEAFQAAAETLASGGSIGDALSVGFHIEGVDTALTNVERVFGNLVIALLQVVSAVQSFTGHGAEAEMTNKAIARLSGGQLSFDLQVANMDEVEGLVAQAVGRGVDPTKIGQFAGEAITELVNSGDFVKAQALINALAAVSDTPVDADMGAIMQGQQAVPVTIDIPDLQAQVNEAVEASKPAPAAGWWDNLKAPADLDFLEKGATTGGGKGEGWWANLAPPPETITAIDSASDRAITAQTDITAAGDATALAVTTATEAVVASAEGAALAVQIMDSDIAAAMMGNTVTASFEAVEDSAVSTMAGVIQAVQSVTPHILQLDALLKAVAAAAATVQQSVNTAIAGAGAAAGAGGNTTNVVVNQNNNVQSPAQATAAGYELGKAVRGMA